MVDPEENENRVQCDRCGQQARIGEPYIFICEYCEHRITLCIECCTSCSQPYCRYCL